MSEPYDSTEDTLRHIKRVREFIDLVRYNLHSRGLVHDASKLVDPEKAILDREGAKLDGLTYGSPEYTAQLKTQDMRPFLDHHYANNPHHPNFYENGVDGMSLFDIIEMACADWPAAVERMKDGDLLESLKINRERFGLSDQLFNVILNTYVEMDILAKPEQQRATGEID